MWKRCQCIFLCALRDFYICRIHSVNIQEDKWRAHTDNEREKRKKQQRRRLNDTNSIRNKRWANTHILTHFLTFPFRAYQIQTNNNNNSNKKKISKVRSYVHFILIWWYVFYLSNKTIVCSKMHFTIWNARKLLNHQQFNICNDAVRCRRHRFHSLVAANLMKWHAY